jgi:hypothetical protein
MRKMIKLRLCFVALLSLASLTTLFSVAQQKSDAASKVLALEAKWNEAYKRSDIATMNSLLADEFIITVEDGSTYSKAGYIAHTGGGTTAVEISEMSGPESSQPWEHSCGNWGISRERDSKREALRIP